VRKKLVIHNHPSHLYITRKEEVVPNHIIMPSYIIKHTSRFPSLPPSPSSSALLLQMMVFPARHTRSALIHLDSIPTLNVHPLPEPFLTIHR
jgi:hypothetical protein